MAIIFYVTDLYCVYVQKPPGYVFSFLQTSEPAEISHDTSGTNSQTNEGAIQTAIIPIVGDILGQFIFVALWAVNGVSYQLSFNGATVISIRGVGMCKILGRAGQKTKCAPSFFSLQIFARNFERRK